MRPPLIVDCQGDLSLFRNVQEMERYLEAIDVNNNEFVVYDSEGRLVQLTTEWAQTTALFGLLKEKVEVVRVRGFEPEPKHADELAVKVLRFLAATGVALPASTSLAELVQHLERRAGYTT